MKSSTRPPATTRFAIMMGFLLSSCLSAEETKEARGFQDPVVAEDGRLFDSSGREILLRGFNARVRGLFDVTFDDGRVALQEIPLFTADDCGTMANDLGQNFLRLPVNWSGIEPIRGAYDDEYLAQILEVVRGCWRHGVYTLVDIHQDAFSKNIGEDGAPLWAILPTPVELLEGPLTEDELVKRRVSPTVVSAFKSLFNNVDGLLDSYAAMAAKLGQVLADEPGVMGLELMNEPVFVDDLAAFHERVGRAVRKVAPNLTLVFEPNALRNFLDSWPVSTPFPFEDAVYAPHLYTDVFTNGWAGRDVEKLHESVGAAKEEAEEHGTPLLIGEYGNSPKTETGLLWLSEALNKMDDVKASGAVWLYEEWSQGGWGLYGRAESERGPLRVDFARIIARPFPQAIDGRLVSSVFDEERLTLMVEIATAGTGEHLLSAPSLLYPDGVSVHCDDELISTLTVSSGRVAFKCQGTRIMLRPLP